MAAYKCLARASAAANGRAGAWAAEVCVRSPIGDGALSPTTMQGCRQGLARVSGCCQLPRVKSGNGSGMLPQATEISESAPGADQVAAS